MKLTSVLQYHVAHIQLQESSEEAKAVQVTEGISFDLGSDGTMGGIEFLDANQQFNGERP